MTIIHYFHGKSMTRNAVPIATAVDRWLRSSAKCASLAQKRSSNSISLTISTHKYGKFNGGHMSPLKQRNDSRLTRTLVALHHAQLNHLEMRRANRDARNRRRCCCVAVHGQTTWTLCRTHRHQSDDTFPDNILFPPGADDRKTSRGTFPTQTHLSTPTSLPAHLQPCSAFFVFLNAIHWQARTWISDKTTSPSTSCSLWNRATYQFVVSSRTHLQADLASKSPLQRYQQEPLATMTWEDVSQVDPYWFPQSLGALSHCLDVLAQISPVTLQHCPCGSACDSWSCTLTKTVQSLRGLQPLCTDCAANLSVFCVSSHIEAIILQPSPQISQCVMSVSLRPMLLWRWANVKKLRSQLAHRVHARHTQQINPSCLAFHCRGIVSINFYANLQ